MSIRDNWRVLLIMAALALVWYYGRICGETPDSPQWKRQPKIDAVDFEAHAAREKITA
jgi:hypothetical protein